MAYGYTPIVYTGTSFWMINKEKKNGYANLLLYSVISNDCCFS